MKLPIQMVPWKSHQNRLISHFYQISRSVSQSVPCFFWGVPCHGLETSHSKLSKALRFSVSLPTSSSISVIVPVVPVVLVIVMVSLVVTSAACPLKDFIEGSSVDCCRSGMFLWQMVVSTYSTRRIIWKWNNYPCDFCFIQLLLLGDRIGYWHRPNWGDTFWQCNSDQHIETQNSIPQKGHTTNGLLTSTNHQHPDIVFAISHWSPWLNGAAAQLSSALCWWWDSSSCWAPWPATRYTKRDWVHKHPKTSKNNFAGTCLIFCKDLVWVLSLFQVFSKTVTSQRATAWIDSNQLFPSGWDRRQAQELLHLIVNQLSHLRAFWCSAKGMSRNFTKQQSKLTSFYIQSATKLPNHQQFSRSADRLLQRHGRDGLMAGHGRLAI